MRTLLVLRVLMRQLLRFSYIVPPRWAFDPQDTPNPSRSPLSAAPFARWPRTDLIRASGSGPVRGPFAAPVRVATVGERCAEIRTALEEWRAQPPSISDAAIKILHVEEVEHLRFEPRAPQIVVISDRDLKRLFRILSRTRRPGERLPRLVICARSRQLWPIFNISALPKGVALLLVPRVPAPSFVCKFMDRIAEGLTLERAVVMAAESIPHTRAAAMLILDEGANHALRFEDLADMVRIDAALSGHLPRSGVESEHEKKFPFGSGREAFAGLGKSIADEWVHFGPRPLESQQRMVEINVLRGLFWAEHSRLLPKSSTLLADTDYFLLVHIGRMLPGGLVAVKARADGNGHNEGGQLLDIVLQEKGFELRTERSQLLYLPSTGASEAVMLGIRTPQESGSAELRISIYLRNQIVQTLLIQAEVADQEYRLVAADRGVVARLEFTQTEDFNDLAILPARALTISVNREQGATHTLMVKGDGGACPFSVPESLISRWVKEYRNLLERATSTDGVKPRFPADANPEATDRNEFLSRLADLGSDLYDGCFYDDSKDGLLASLRDASDGIISVVRHDPRFAFPWQIFYDFPLPTRFYGMTPEVCLGLTREGRPCGHTSKDKIYCVRGFWGYRHQIEEMIGAISSTDTNAPSQQLNAASQARQWDTSSVRKTISRMISSNC